jgi:outer membrane protein assembly factor BamB
MTIPENMERSRERLRLWPGVTTVVLQWFIWFALPIALPEAMIFGVLGGLALGLAVLIWWAFFSRAPRYERWGAIVLMIAAMAATPRILHPSIATGMMGMMFWMYAVPVMSLALVGGAAASRRLGDGPRRAVIAASILAGCAVFTLLRTDGITGDGHSQFAWRWSKTSEQQLLARTGNPPAPQPAALTPKEPPQERPAPLAADGPPARPAALRTAAPAVIPAARTIEPSRDEWPGFRGPHRDSIVTGLRINTNWAASPPVELWRRPVGPGWSSFAVGDGLIYTQEQRGDLEVVACYKAATGEPVWSHSDAARFWESNGGAGPRATPTLHEGRVYTFGATGIVNALDASNGAVVWSRNAASDTKTKVPGWGFAGSPLVVDDVVIVAAAGQLAAYDAATGASRWLGPRRGAGYSSPHLATINGVPQIVLASAAGAISVAPADGKLLWEYDWRGDGIVQPAMLADDVLIGSGSGIGSGAGIGIRRVSLKHGTSGWTAEERWTSPGLKPYFNDFIIHGGHAYGFDGSILSCIDLKDGKRKWKGGRYGHGQLLLLRDQDLLLVLSEEGDLALVAAAPDQFTEVARFHAMEGKTWNHPVLAGDILFVRNGEEMVAFRLSPAGV